MYEAWIHLITFPTPSELRKELVHEWRGRASAFIAERGIFAVTVLLFQFLQSFPARSLSFDIRGIKIERWRSDQLNNILSKYSSNRIVDDAGDVSTVGQLVIFVHRRQYADSFLTKASCIAPFGEYTYSMAADSIL